ncbi:hypothetical protein Gotur_027864 [Gossypium turneri]
MKEEKMNLRLDVDVQKLEADKLRKGKNKTEEELDSLKTDYKKLRLSMRTAGLEKFQSSGVKRFEKKETSQTDGKGNFKRFKHEMKL